MTSTLPVGIALGANLGDRLAQLREARMRVSQIPGMERIVACSAVYETEPVDCLPGTPGFLNAVIEAETSLHPSQLLEALQRVENQMGRPEKRPRNAPRPIDLDILYAGNLVLNNEEVIIPHPRLHLRRFVLAPLVDLSPTLLLPGQTKTVAELLWSLEDSTQVIEVCRTW